MVYASDLMVNKSYRLMTIVERGMYFTLLCECWANGAVPKPPDDLAKWLGYPLAEIRVGLTERVLSFFIEESGELKSPDLERYRSEVLERRAKMSAGGAKGGKISGKVRAENCINSSTLAKAPLKGGAKGVESEIEVGSETASTGANNLIDPWLEDYERASSG